MKFQGFSIFLPLLSVVFLASCSSGYEADVFKNIIIDQDDAYPGSNAKIVSYEFPDKVYSGESYPLKIVFQNTGETPWFFMAKYQIGLGVGSLSFGGKAKFKLPAHIFVRPGGSYEFLVELEMPNEPGEYYEHFRMVRLEDRWFGETLELRVKLE